MKKLIPVIKKLFIVVTLLASVAITHAATTFQDPATAGYTFSNNVEAPINVGSDPQIKGGNLTVSNFTANSISSNGTIYSFGNLGSLTKLGIGIGSIPASLTGYINGNVGAVKYCDVYGGNCVVPDRVIGLCPDDKPLLKGFNDDGSKNCVAATGGNFTITQGNGINISGTNNTISVDFSTVQRLLSSSCTLPNFVQSINPTTGAVTCATPSGGSSVTINTSTGITNTVSGNNNTLGLDFNAVQKRVTGTCAAGSSINAIDSAGAVTCNAGGTSISGPVGYLSKFDASGTNLDRSVIFQSGTNLGVSTITPGYKFEVVGNIGATGFFYRSDASLKKNIKTLDNALDKIMSIRGVSFNWKEDNRPDIGVIAQEVEKVFPDVVHTTKEGIKSVEYGNLVAPLIEAIKEQQKEIELLKKEVTELKNK